MRNTTIKDIAKQAGVSVGTVSKVLNGRTDIREANLRSVQQAIDSLNYTVNKNARILARSPFNIGVIMPNPELYQYFKQIKNGIVAQLNDNVDSKCLLDFVEYDSFDEEAEIISALEKFIDNGYDGVILAPAFNSGYQDYLHKLSKRNIPLVFLGSEIVDAPRLASVRSDPKRIGQMTADFSKLILAGDESVAILLGNKNTLEHAEKAEYFTARAEKIGLNVSGIYETQEDLELAYLLTKKIISGVPSLKLIYVATGRAMSVCKAIKDAGREGDLKVLITDNIYEGLEEYIESGIIIGAVNQHAEQQGRDSFLTMYEYLTEKKLYKDGQIRIEPSLALLGEMEDAIKNS